MNKSSKNTYRLTKILSFAEKERLKKVEIIFQRLSIIAKSNPKFTTVFEELTHDFDEMEDIFRTLSEGVRNISFEVKTTTTTTTIKKFNEEIIKLEYINETFETKLRNFNSKANGLLKKEEFLRNEMSFCREKLRTISILYTRKRVILDKISSEIDALNSNIVVLTESFNKLIEKGDNERASEIMNEIRAKIIIFAKIINEGPKMQATIFGTIPSFIKKLINLYQRAEKELKVDLSHIDFNANLVELSQKFKLTKELFQKTKLDECKKLIISLVKNIKAIERNINFEIKARNIFIQNYQATIDIVKTNLNQYVELRKEVKTLPSNDKTKTVGIVDNFSLLKEEIKILDESAMSFADLFKNQSVPYMSKLSRMKIILNKTISITIIMNGIYELIWEDHIIKKTIRNQFLQVEQALITLRAQVIEKSILLSAEEVKQLEFIAQAKQKLKLLLSAVPFNSKLAGDISTTLVDNVSSYYKVVGGKIEMSEIVSNLIKEFSASRALYGKLNIVFSQAEKKYLEGSYAAALNMLIDGIKEFKNTKKKRQ